MRTVLPLPEQEDFRVWLPERVRFSATTVIEYAGDGLSLTRNGTSLSITLAAPARNALVAALAEGGTGLPTGGLAPTWRQLLDKLAASGMLADAAPADTCGGVSALDALVAVLDQIHRDTIACFAGDSALQRLIGGRYDQVAVVRWLVENYHYTKSAEHHISPVLHHAMSASERRVWSSFLKDESWHWRIYRPAFAQFGLRFEELDARPPAPSTRHFIETLHAISCGGPVAYAAAMIFIEQPPLSTDVGSDPLYSSLMTHYGFSRSSIRPLWWHATENLVAGHSGLGAVVITNRRIVSRSELDMALQAATDTIHAVSAWHEGVLTGC